MKQDDTAKYIIAVYRGDYDIPRLEFGNPGDMAKNWPDASAYYMTDNNSCTMVRLEYERKVWYVGGKKDNAETKHIWRYAESVLQPHLSDFDSIEHIGDNIGDGPEHEGVDSFFGALKKQVMGNNPHISRGDVYASVVTEGVADAPTQEPAPEEESSEVNA